MKYLSCTHLLILSFHRRPLHPSSHPSLLRDESPTSGRRSHVPDLCGSEGSFAGLLGPAAGMGVP